jgi:hypothetical protein
MQIFGESGASEVEGVTGGGLQGRGLTGHNGFWKLRSPTI